VFHNAKYQNNMNNKIFRKKSLIINKLNQYNKNYKFEFFIFSEKKIGNNIPQLKKQIKNFKLIEKQRYKKENEKYLSHFFIFNFREKSTQNNRNRKSHKIQ